MHSVHTMCPVQWWLTPDLAIVREDGSVCVVPSSSIERTASADMRDAAKELRDGSDTDGSSSGNLEELGRIVHDAVRGKLRKVQDGVHSRGRRHSAPSTGAGPRSGGEEEEEEEGGGEYSGPFIREARLTDLASALHTKHKHGTPRSSSPTSARGGAG
ncbi:hypothetical protein EON62_03215, partial [archaeon]